MTWATTKDLFVQAPAKQMPCWNCNCPWSFASPSNRPDHLITACGHKWWIRTPRNVLCRTHRGSSSFGSASANFENSRCSRRTALRRVRNGAVHGPKRRLGGLCRQNFMGGNSGCDARFRREHAGQRPLIPNPKTSPTRTTSCKSPPNWALSLLN